MKTKNLRGTFMKRNTYGFTLVELIVVISILVILGTIAFVNLQGFAGGARDSARTSDLANLTQAFELTYIKSGFYPTPTNGSGVTYSGGTVWTQGTIGDSVMSVLGAGGNKFSKKPTDPKYPTIEYTYSLLNTGKEYQLAAAMEDSTTAYTPLITPVYAATDSLTAYLKGNYNGLIAKASTGTTTYYLALPSIILQSLSNTELSVPATQFGNLVLHKKGNIPSSYTANQIQSPITSNFNYSLLSTSTGIVAYSTIASSLDSTGATTLMTNLYNAYSGSNLKGDTTSANQVSSLVTGGTGTLMDLYNGVVSKSIGATATTTTSSTTPPPTTTFSLSTTSVTAGTPVTITDNCTTHPTSYTSSATSIATISATTITTLTAGTTNITPVGGNCSDSAAKTLTVTAPPVLAYSSVTTYTAGMQFTLSGETVTVTSTGYGTGNLTAEPGCTKPDIAIWNGTNVQIWSACNVGATAAGTGTVVQSCNAGCAALATNYSSSLTNFGGYFEWGNNGNLVNGTWSTTSQPACPASIDSSYSQATTFYQYQNTTNYDWCSGTQNNNLWGNTTNTSVARKGPCQAGYHTPTGGTADATTEWGAAYTIANVGSIGSCSQVNVYDRIQCILLLPLSGYRAYSVGSFYDQGFHSYYWSSSPSSTYAFLAYFYAGGGNITYNNLRAYGFSVRCLKN